MILWKGTLFLPIILDVMSCFTRIRSGAEDGGGGDALWEAGALNDYFPHRKGAGNNLDLILGAAAPAGQRKITISGTTFRTEEDKTLRQ
jgi:hypothetical protein